MSNTLDKLLGGKQGAIGLALLAALILVVFPLALDAFRLNMVGKYRPTPSSPSAWCCAGAMAAS